MHQSNDSPRPVGMWDAERAHPWRAAVLYLAVLFGSIAASAIAARVWP